MPFLTEPHCHTSEVSACGKASAACAIEKYLAAGFTTLVITNHLSPATFNPEKKYKGGDTWREKLDYFFAGIDLAKKLAEGTGLNILWGVELRNGEWNDFLIYGLSREFYENYPNILDDNFKTISQRIRDAGGIIFQAHPFRNGMEITRPELLDGVEVYNGSYGNNESRNDVANYWADKFSLKKLSGNDFHDEKKPLFGGIETDFPIRTQEELEETLKSGNYRVLRAGMPPILPEEQ